MSRPLVAGLSGALGAMAGLGWLVVAPPSAEGHRCELVAVERSQACQAALERAAILVAAGALGAGALGYWASGRL